MLNIVIANWFSISEHICTFCIVRFKLDLFKTCDVDKDNFLSLEEFQAFSRPEDFNHTQGLEISRILHEHDTNKDGAIDVKEFLHAELHEDDPKEWIEIETVRDTHRKNGDRQWSSMER